MMLSYDGDAANGHINVHISLMPLLPICSYVNGCYMQLSTLSLIVNYNRGGNGNGLLGWCRKALSAYTWCRTSKGLQNEWLFKIKKMDTESCKCGSKTMTGTHVVEECPELDQWRPRRAVWKEWREALGGRAVSKKEAEEEGDLLGAFFYRVYDFFFSFSNPPPIIHRPCVPARYAIKFVPASCPSVVTRADSVIIDHSVVPPVSPVIVSSVSSSFSVVSSANFVISVPIPPSTYCIPTT